MVVVVVVVDRLAMFLAVWFILEVLLVDNCCLVCESSLDVSWDVRPVLYPKAISFYLDTQAGDFIALLFLKVTVSFCTEEYPSLEATPS